MVIFVDTSALYAYVDQSDARYGAVLAAWDLIESAEDELVTTNYVLMEAVALLQSRLGLGAVRDFVDSIVPLLSVEWVEPEIHEAGLAAVLAANRRELSLVDCVSFEVMRRLGIRQAFALDGHFREQGFEVVP